MKSKQVRIFKIQLEVSINQMVEKIGELEEKSFEISQAGGREHLKDLQDIIKGTDVHIFGITEEEG